MADRALRKKPTSVPQSMRAIMGPIKTVPIDDVSPHPRNARRGDVESVMESLAYHGQFRPLVVQKSTHYILAGNHTWMAAKELHWDTIAVTFLDVDDEQAIKILLVDNAVSDKGGYDYDALLDIIGGIQGDLVGTGYTDEVISNMNRLLDGITEGISDNGGAPPDEVLARSAYDADDDPVDVDDFDSLPSVMPGVKSLKPDVVFMTDDWYGIPDLIEGMLFPRIDTSVDTWSGPTSSTDDGESLYCLAPHTRVLTEDLRYVPIGTVCVGDRLAGFDEESPERQTEQKIAGTRQWRSGMVTAIGRASQPSYRLTMSDGTVIDSSEGHRWLATKGRAQRIWLTTAELVSRFQSGQTARVIKVLETWDELQSRSAGYLAGMFDGEGCMTNWDDQFRVSMVQKANSALDDAEMYLKEHDFQYGKYGPSSSGCYTLVISGGKSETLRFLGSVRPSRLVDNFIKSGGFDGLREMHAKAVTVASVEFLGDMEVVTIETTTKTLIAEGYAHHNCYTYGTDSTKGMPWDRTLLNFFTSDSRFENWWADPSKYVAKMMAAGLAGAVEPDFSLFAGLPRVLHIFNVYRNRWLARYMQEAGIKVVPHITFADNASLDFCMSGIPIGAPVIALQMQTVDDAKEDRGARIIRECVEHIVEALEPEQLLIYGGMPGFDLIKSYDLPEETELIFAENRSIRRSRWQKERDKAVYKDAATRKKSARVTGISQTGVAMRGR